VQTLAILQGINLQIERYLRLHLLLTDSVDKADREHRELLRLCESGNVEGATKLLKQHIQNAGRSLLTALRKHRSALAAT
jgi:DNA-binding GntR family transcriptional regulator